MLVSDESLLDTARRDAQLLRLTYELRNAQEALQLAQAQRAAFELDVLNSRDFAVGQAATIGELRYRAASQSANQIARLEAALAAVRQELAAVRASTTWKLGRILMFPVRTAKRILRRG